jgi:colicin import membrane protein
MEARLQSQAAAEARVREELSVVRASLKADESGVQQELLKSREESHRQKRELDARLQEAETRAAESAASASRAEAELALLKGRSERALQAREAEQAQIESRVISAGGELEAAKAQLKAAEAERALLRGQLEKERKARAEDQAAMAARAEGEIQHREALEALTHEVTALRRDKADLTHRLDSVRARAEENAQADREVAQLRGTLVSVKKEQAESETRARQRLAEIDERLGHAVRAGEEAVREAAAGRDRIRLLESRLAENARPSARPAWAAGPVIDAPMADSAPQDRPVSEPRPAAEPRSAPDPVRVPPRKAGSLAGLEAQAQAELKAWQEKKQVPPAVENPPRNKSWLPWKKS